MSINEPSEYIVSVTTYRFGYPGASCKHQSFICTHQSYIDWSWWYPEKEVINVTKGCSYVYANRWIDCNGSRVR